MSVSWVRLLSSQKGHLVHEENISVCRQILKVHTRPFFYTNKLFFCNQPSFFTSDIFNQTLDLSKTRYVKKTTTTIFLVGC